MRWLQSWLRTTADGSGPRCTDGTLLKEMPFTGKTCDERAYSNLTEIIPGCEIETIPQLPVNETVSQLPVLKTVSQLPVLETVPEPVPDSVGKNQEILNTINLLQMYMSDHWHFYIQREQ